MSFARYSKYKHSNAEWFDSVPSHWQLQPCRAVFTERNERNDPLINEAYLSLMANVGVIPYEEKGDVGNKKPEDLGKCKQVYPGDLVINSMNYGIGSFGLSNYRGVCSPVYIVLIAQTKKIEERFAFRILETKQFQKYAQSFGNGILEHRSAINWDILKVIKMPLPPINEQQEILSFLDRKTSEIDNLITEQKLLIELLNEKRRNLISEAITKGINKSAQMKHSGVEWIGHIPSHWEVTKLSRVTRQIVDGAHFTPTYVEEGVPFLRVTDITSRTIDLNAVKRIPQSEHDELLKRCWPERGDLLVSKNGTIGVPKVIDWDWEFSIFVSLCLIKFGPRLTAKFAKYVFLSNQIRIQIEESSKQSTVINLHLDKIQGFKFPIPPTDEQAQIVEYLDDESPKFDALIDAALTAIELLQERRSALITSAVTGQIDIRSLVVELEHA